MKKLEKKYLDNWAAALRDKYFASIPQSSDRNLDSWRSTQYKKLTLRLVNIKDNLNI